MTRGTLVVAGCAVVALAVAVVWVSARPRASGAGASVSLAAPDWDVVVDAAGPRVVSPRRRPVMRGDSISGWTRQQADDQLDIDGRALTTRGRGVPLTAGATAVVMGQQTFVPLSRPETPNDAMLIVGAEGSAREVPLPAGLRVVAARAGATPELLSFGEGDGGSVAVVRSVVKPDGSVEERERATVPYTPKLRIEPSVDQRCGLPGERFLPLVARGPSGGVLIAVTDEHLFPLRFPLAERATVTPVCGTCPPLALARDGDDLTLLVTVGRKLAKSVVGPLPERPVRDASGACTSTRTAVAVLAGEHVYVATTHADSGWKLDAARRVDGLDGANLSQVRLAADHERLTLFVGRSGATHVDVRTSTDGGDTWK